MDVQEMLGGWLLSAYWSWLKKQINVGFIVSA